MDDDSMKVALDIVRKCAEQNNRALFGSNGESGLITEVVLIKAAVERISNNDLPHMKEDIMDEIGKLQEKAVQWPAIRSGVIAIASAIITALLVTWLHSIFFP